MVTNNNMHIVDLYDKMKRSYYHNVHMKNKIKLVDQYINKTRILITHTTYGGLAQ